MRGARTIASLVSLLLAGTGLGGEPQTHPVLVGNDFFSPRVLEIEVGDTVVWTNASGLHNVFSCIPSQFGCDATATETFSSGPPADPIWIYSYTFQVPGSNPYICQSHAPFMTGVIEVAEPAPVPGVTGAGLLALVTLLLAASTVLVLRGRANSVLQPLRRVQPVRPGHRRSGTRTRR